MGGRLGVLLWLERRLDLALEGAGMDGSERRGELGVLGLGGTAESE